MSLFPIFLKLEGRQCLVVGGGAIATEKIDGLLPTGAEIRVVAPRVTRRIRELLDEKRVLWTERKFRPADLNGIFLVVASTSSKAVHEDIYRASRRRGVLCNVVDDPPHCDFYYGSVVRRGALQIAISTAGQSPALAQRIRKIFEDQFGPEYEEWIEALGEARQRLFARKMDPVERKNLLHVLASDEIFQDFLKRKR